MHLEKEIAVEIETFEDSFSVDIDWDASDIILRPREYVDYWRIFLWDRAFKHYLGDNPDNVFAKGDNLLEFEEGLLLSSVSSICNAFILNFGISHFFHFLLIHMDFLPCYFDM